MNLGMEGDLPLLAYYGYAQKDHGKDKCLNSSGWRNGGTEVVDSMGHNERCKLFFTLFCVATFLQSLFSLT
jgi:hypothetical protein